MVGFEFKGIKFSMERYSGRLRYRKMGGHGDWWAGGNSWHSVDIDLTNEALDSRFRGALGRAKKAYNRRYK